MSEISKRDVQNLASQTTAAETQFLHNEIHPGLSFTKIALEAEDPSKIERNRTNARKAYDALLHFIPNAVLSPEETTQINSGLAELKADLQKLGEEV